MASHNLSLQSVYTITPKNCVHSEDIIKNCKKSEQEYYRDSYQKFGVKKRYVASDNENFETLASRVAETQIKDIKINKENINCLIVVSQTSSSRLPNAGHLIHKKLKLNQECIVIDINDGCNGYVNALEIAAKFILNDQNKYVLIIAGDFMSRHTNYEEVSNKLLIGDAITSSLVNFSKKINGFSLIKNDGSDAEVISLSKQNENEIFSMDGFKVYSFTMQKVPRLYKEFISSFSLKNEDFDHIVLHQANQLLNSNIIRRLKLDPDIFPSSLLNYANTGPASIPLTISTMNFQKKSNLLLIGFGAGLSWGSFSINNSCPIVKIIN